MRGCRKRSCPWPCTSAASPPPGEIREHRFLATAYLRAHDYQRARRVVDAALELAPDDAALLALRGESKAGLADPEGALADWEHALELDPDDIGPLYSSAFLLECEGRVAAAADAWRSILDWNESRGYTLQSEWPREQLDRLRNPWPGYDKSHVPPGGPLC